MASDPALLAQFLMYGSIGIALVHVSISDVRHGVIHNSISATLAVIGVVGQLVLVAAGRDSLPNLLGRVGVSVLVGLLLCFRRVWAPGDAKLFWAIVVALPASAVAEEHLLSLDSLIGALVTNSFGLAFIYLSARSVRASDRGLRYLSWQRHLIRPMVISGFAVGIVQILAGAIVEWTLREDESLIVVVITATALHGVRLKPETIVALTCVAGIGAWIAVLSGGIYQHSVVVTVGWLLVCGYELLLAAGTQGFARPILSSSVVAGLTLRSDVLDQVSGCVLARAGSPLTTIQAKAIRSFGESVTVACDASMPFAPLLAAGTVSTVLLGGSVVSPLEQLLSAGLGQLLGSG